MKIDIKTVLLAASFLIAGILISSLFRPKPETNKDLYKQLIQAKDDIVKAKDEVIKAKQEENTKLDVRMHDHLQQDSIIRAQLINNQPKYLTNDKKLIQVRADVADLDREQLRRAFAAY